MGGLITISSGEPKNKQFRIINSVSKLEKLPLKCFIVAPINVEK